MILLSPGEAEVNRALEPLLARNRPWDPTVSEKPDRDREIPPTSRAFPGGQGLRVLKGNAREDRNSS